MSKTGWSIVVVIVVLIILYIVYRYMFNKQNQLTTNNGGVIIPVAPVLNSPVIHQTNGVGINAVVNDENTTLTKMMNCLGYQTQPIKDNAVQAYVTNKTLELFEKKFPKQEVVAVINNVTTSNVITVTTNGVVYKLDKEKFIEMQGLGLYNMIAYNNTNKDQIKSFTDKLNNFWGVDYFASCLGFQNPISVETAKVISKINESSKTKVDCTSSQYQDKLRRLLINFKQAGNKYQLAVFNLNNVDNAENTQALNNSSKVLSETEKEYKKYLTLCNA